MICAKQREKPELCLTHSEIEVYLSGELSEEQIMKCELHISRCVFCHETIVPIVTGGMIMIADKSNSRGQSFENRVRKLLEDLRDRHTDSVEIEYQPELHLHTGETVYPDFELMYDLGFQKDARLIECQSRKRSSSAIVHKIRHIKSLSTRNRFIFVYEDEAFLSESVRSSLEADGVSFYAVKDFEAFIASLDKTLTDMSVGATFEKIRERTQDEIVHRLQSIRLPRPTTFPISEMLDLFKPKIE